MRASEEQHLVSDISLRWINTSDGPKRVFSPVRGQSEDTHEFAQSLDPPPPALTVLQSLCTIRENRQLWRVHEIQPGFSVLQLAPSVELDQHHIAWKARHAYEQERRRLQAETERYPILGKHLR